MCAEPVYLPGASCDGCVLFLCDSLCPVVGCTRRAGVPARAVFLWFGARAVLVLPVRRAVCFLCAATGERAPSIIFLVCSCCATCVRDVCARHCDSMLLASMRNTSRLLAFARYLVVACFLCDALRQRALWSLTQHDVLVVHLHHTGRE